MAGAIDAWEMGICTKLVANCGSWVACGKPAIRQLNLLQDSYLHMVYACPPSTPIPALRALAGVWDSISHTPARALRALEKLCLVTTVLHNRNENNYAKELLEEELLHSWWGITQEVKTICKDMGLPDATNQFVGRSEAKEALGLHHLRIIKEEMKGKSKCDQIYIKDIRVMQDFMKEKYLENARMEVLWMTNMLDTRSIMKGKYDKQYCYPHCKEGREQGTLENPQHLMHCEAYLQFRQGCNPEDDFTDRAVYLRKGITKRKDLEVKLKLKN